MTNPDRHQPKKGAPDYRGEWGKEKSERQKLERILEAAEQNEENLLNRLEKQAADLTAVQNDYVRKVNEVRALEESRDKSEEYTDHALDDRDSACKECRSSVIINWALFGVIVLMIIWINNYMELIG